MYFEAIVFGIIFDWVLFVSVSSDISDCNLRTSLVHLIAVAIGCGKSTHLWYSIFQPNELINTYISGFMVSMVLRLSARTSYF